MQFSQGSKSLLDLKKKAYFGEVMLHDFQHNLVWTRQDVEEWLKLLFEDMKILLDSNSEYQHEEIAKLEEGYRVDDLMRIVFGDNGFKDAEVKTNAIQILKQSGINDVKSLQGDGKCIYQI